MVVRTSLSRVTVYENEISAAFKSPGGDIRRNMNKVGLYFTAIAQTKTAPKRTGALAASIGWRVLPAFSRYETMISITVGADYAIYTLAGTGPWITSNRGTVMTRCGPRPAAMRVRPAPFSHYATPTYRTAVRGQQGHDWMELTTRVVFKGMGLN